LAPRLFTIMVPMSDDVTIWSASQGRDFQLTLVKSKIKKRQRIYLSDNWKDRKPFIINLTIHDHGSPRTTLSLSSHQGRAMALQLAPSPK